MVAFDDGVKRMLGDIERWRDAPLWDPASIARATRNVVPLPRKEAALVDRQWFR